MTSVNPSPATAESGDAMLFCLEMFVQAVERLNTTLHTPAVGFRLLDFPLVLVHQPPEHAAATAAAGASAIAAACSSSSHALRFSAGKSALFQLGESGLANLLSLSPLQVLLLDLQLIRSPKLVASTTVDLSAMRRDMLVPVASQGSGFHRGVFPLRDLMGNEVGLVSLVLRLCCMGSAMLPHLRAIPQLTREKQEWVARSVQSAKDNAASSSGTSVSATARSVLSAMENAGPAIAPSTHSATGVSSHSLSAIPPQIAQLDPLPRDDTATTYRAKEDARAARRAQFEAEEAARERMESGESPAGPATSQQQPPSQPATLSSPTLDPSVPSSHRAQLTLGPSVSVTQKPLSKVSRYHTLETLNDAISRELAHHNLAPVGSQSQTHAQQQRANDAPWIADLTAMAKSIVPQADDYAPPALFFFRDSAQAEQQNQGLLEVEYRRAVKAERSREEQATRDRRSMYEPENAQRLQIQQQQHQQHPQHQPHWPAAAESEQHPSQVTFHSESMSNHAPTAVDRHPSHQYSNAAATSAAQSAPGSPSASRRSALRSAPPATSAAPVASPSRSPLTPHRQQLRHHPSAHQQQFDPAQLSLSRPRPGSRSRSRSASPNRISNLERKYREMESQIALENKQRAREAAWDSDVLHPAPAPALIPRGRAPRVAPEDRTRPVRAASRPKTKGSFDAGLTPPKPELTPRIDDPLESDVLGHPKPAVLPTEYGAFKPVPKLKGLPLAALDQPGVPRRMNRGAAANRPKSATAVSGGARGSHKAGRPASASASASRQQPLPARTASTTPYARAFEEVEHLHDQLDSQREMLDDRPIASSNAPTSPSHAHRRRHPSVQHASASPPLSPSLSQRGSSKHVQFQRASDPRVDSNVQPRIPAPPSPTPSELAAGSTSGARGFATRFSDWNDPGTSADAPQKQELDSLFSQVESKLAARAELLYRARDSAAPAEYISPLSPWSQVEAARATRSAMIDAALDIPSRPAVSESSLAAVALDYLNHSEPKSRAEMSEYLLRQQLAEIRALTSQPAAAIEQQLYDLSRAQVQRQPQMQHALHPHPQQLEQAMHGQYQWEENLSLAS